MGRMRGFEDKKVLQKAMLLFWEKGYENTSLKDLLKEMNILNGSFYNTFGNKKNLLIQTLEYYSQEVGHQRAEILASHPKFKDGIRAFFEETFLCATSKNRPKGCLLANSLNKEVLEDPEIKSFLKKEHENFENFFEENIERAIEAGELDNSIDSQIAASTLVAYIQGCIRLSGVSFDIAKFRAQTEFFLTSIGL